MKNVIQADLHPDIFWASEGCFNLRMNTAKEIDDLQAVKEQATSSAELYWVEQKKLELFTRIFGF